MGEALVVLGPAVWGVPDAMKGRCVYLLVYFRRRIWGEEEMYSICEMAGWKFALALRLVLEDGL
jgi:hypothetical protein